MRALLVCLIVACAPQIDGPVERQRAIDREDEARLAHQLAELPGSVHADVTLHRPVRDPLGDARPGSAAVLVVIDDRADRGAIEASARRLVRATVPEIPEPALVVEVGAVRPALAQVGPFTVEAASKPRLVAVLACAFATIAGLAGWIALRYRRGRSAQ